MLLDHIRQCDAANCKINDLNGDFICEIMDQTGKYHLCIKHYNDIVNATKLEVVHKDKKRWNKK
jgi:hypothetical protein